MLGTSIGEAEEVGVWGGPWGMAGAAVVGLGVGLWILSMKSDADKDHADAPPSPTQDCPDKAPAEPAKDPPPNKPPFPKDPQQLLDEGWKETSHPDAAANGHRTFTDPKTGAQIRLDKGEPGVNGYRGEDHYHWKNPNGSGFLDENGNPVRRGSDPSHIPPR